MACNTLCSWCNSLSLLLFLLGSLMPCNGLRNELPFSFSFGGFGKNVSLDSQFSVHRDAEISRSVVRLTRPVNYSEGLMVYREPVRLWGSNPGFSTYFSFSASSGNGSSISLFLVPSSVQLESRAVVSSVGSISIELLHTNESESLIGIRVGSNVTVERSNPSARKLVPKDREKLHSWIDYDGSSKRIEVRFSRTKDSRPVNSSVSFLINLSDILSRDAMLVGISSSNGNCNQSCSVYSWTFSANNGAPYSMHSEPLDPDAFVVHSDESSPVHHRKFSFSWQMLVAMLLAAAFGALLTFCVVFLWFRFAARLPVAAECPVHPVNFDEKIVLAEGKVVDCGKQ